MNACSHPVPVGLLAADDRALNPTDNGRGCPQHHSPERSQGKRCRHDDHAGEPGLLSLEKGQRRGVAAEDTPEPHRQGEGTVGASPRPPAAPGPTPASPATAGVVLPPQHVYLCHLTYGPGEPGLPASPDGRSCMFPTESPTVSRGMEGLPGGWPVPQDVSRMLGNTLLLEVDTEQRAHCGI